MLTVLLERTRQDLERDIVKLRQQVDSVTEQSRQSDDDLKLALHNEKQAHNADVDCLTAEKVIIIIFILLFFVCVS